MVMNYYPEHLGHCIMYKGPSVFNSFLAMVKRWCDPKTVSKIVMVTGDDSDGSKNDQLMMELVGADWKRKVGVGQPVLSPGCTPGYNFDEYWAKIMAEEDAREGAAAPAATATATATETTTVATR